MTSRKKLGLYPEFDSPMNADMAERLRRVTRNHLGSPRAGSNPAVCDFFCIIRII